MKNKIRMLRAGRRWSQAELAGRVGVSRNSINSIENGRYNPSLSLAFAIADVFESRIEEVFERDAPKRDA
jgi:putative transcriptional regulator